MKKKKLNLELKKQRISKLQHSSIKGGVTGNVSDQVGPSECCEKTKETDPHFCPPTLRGDNTCDPRETQCYNPDCAGLF